MKLTDDAEHRYRKQQYLDAARPIEGVELVDLRRFHDDGGSMTELARLADGSIRGLAGFRLAQINYSTLTPGSVKAFHLHKAQTDVWYVPPEDRVLLVLADVRDGSPTAGSRMRLLLGDTRSALVKIPPGVAHGCRNVGAATARIVYFTDLLFSPDPQTTDEGRLPWDWLGPELWEASRE